MSAYELAAWAMFEENFGPITPHERIDAAATRIAYTVHATAGGNLPPDHFVMRWQRPKRWSDDQIWTWLGMEAKKGQG